MNRDAVSVKRRILTFQSVISTKVGIIFVVTFFIIVSILLLKIMKFHVSRIRNIKKFFYNLFKIIIL